MRYSQDLLDRIRERLSLSDIVGQSVSLKQKGAYHLGLCPFHTEKTPSFTVTNAKGIYYCFGCGSTGTVYDFLMKQRGFAFPDAVKYAAEKAGVALPKEEFSPEQEKQEKERLLLFEVLKAAQSFYKDTLKSAEGQRARAYIEKRNITLESQSRFGLGYAPAQQRAVSSYLKEKGYASELMEAAGLLQQRKEKEGVTRVDRLKGRLIFPILDKKGRLIGFGGRSLNQEEPKYLNSPETLLFKKGETLYGIYEIYKNTELLKKISNGTQPFLVVEGYIDVISLNQEGIASVSPMGTALTEQQLLETWRLSSEPYLCFDGDMAGKRAAMRALDKALPFLKPGFSLKFIFLPKGEDPDSLIQSGRKEVFLNSLHSALSLADTLWGFLVEEKRFDTPELLAAFKKEYKGKLSTIKDKDVREAYHNDFDERFEKFYVSKQFSKGFQERKFFASKKEKSLNVLKTISQKNTLPHVQKIQDASFTRKKVLLGMVIRYPFLLEEEGESLLGVSFFREEYATIRDELIYFYEQGNPLEFEALHIYLITKGYDYLVKEFFEKDLLVVAPFLKGYASSEEIKEHWKELWSLIEEEPMLKKDIEVAKEDFLKTMSSEAWQRLRLLRQLPKTK